ncbi:MAG: alpha/beta hydrolase [bacterium]|nr:alpha/beta hydrolase [bacterium]
MENYREEKTRLELNKLILDITTTIQAENPELLNYLNEMPVTIPNEAHPEVDVNTLRAYYESLVILLDRYEGTHSKKRNPEERATIPVTEIRTMKEDKSSKQLVMELNNVVVSYQDVGEGSVPILFLHGFPFDKWMWKGQLDDLKSSNRVIAYDIRGFGKSTDEKSPLSIDLFTEDLVLFMDKLNIEKAIICGLSMGGYIVLNAIKRFPERFAAIILCDTQCIADTPEVKEKRYATIEQIKLNGAEAFNEKFVQSVFHPDSLVEMGELVKNLRSTVFSNSDQIIAAGLTALAERGETCSILEAIKVPTLIMCGKADQLTPVAQAEFMHKHIKGSRVEVIEKAGHVSNLEQPDEFNKHLRDFLKSVSLGIQLEK